MRAISKRPTRALLAMVAAFATHAYASGQTITVVNIMPRGASWETGQNSEPNITVNPLLPSFLVATATIGNAGFCPGDRAQAYVSANGGDRWHLVCILPAEPPHYPMDMTVRFAGDGLSLYAGMMRFSSLYSAYIYNLIQAGGAAPSPDGLYRALVLDPGNPDAATPMLLARRDQTDQPYIASWPSPTGSAMAVGVDDRVVWDMGCASSGTVYWWSNTDLTRMSASCISARPTTGPTPAVRVAIHGDGTIYAIQYRPIDMKRADVVVSRSDPVPADRRSSGPNAFTAVIDTPITPQEAQSTDPCSSRDFLPGFRLAPCIFVPMRSFGTADIGEEWRLASDLSIAVDPSRSRLVYAAWTDSVAGNASPSTLHVAESTDGGTHWLALPFVVDNAINPALAVATDGALGILYQQFIPSAASGRWKTFFAIREPPFPGLVRHELADMPVLPAPGRVSQPYLGDYIHLEAHGRNFYGIFSASNDLTTTSIQRPSIVQRLYDKTGKPVDRNGRPVTVSMDPYFVRIIR